MSKKYAIWNKTDKIYTPAGEVLTASQWIERYPIAGESKITVLCSAGDLNGAFFGTLGTMVMQYERLGCDFSKCKTDEEKLATIEAFDDAREVAEKQAIAEEKARADIQADSLLSIAASLEYQNMMTLPDVEV